MKIFGEYEDKRLGNEYLDFVTDVKTVINYGKYTPQIVSAVPSWTGDEGEECYRYIANGTASLYVKYFYLNSSWNWQVWIGSGGGLFAV